MNKKKIGFVRAAVFYHGAVVIFCLIMAQQLPASRIDVYKPFFLPLLFGVTGTFLCFFGLKNILYYTFLYRSGRRLMSKEAQLKSEGIDFEQIRQGDDR